MTVKRVICITWWVGILIILGVACQSVEFVEPKVSTPPEQLAIGTKVSQPLTQAAPTLTITAPLQTPSLLTITPNPTASYTPLPTEVTEAATSSSANPLLEKVDELPISGTELAISRDGLFLAASNTNTGVLYVFDMALREVKWELEEDSRTMTGYTALSFSPNGNLLAGGGINQDVFVWDVNNGELIFSLPVSYDVVDALSFSPDGNFLAISAFNDPTPNVEVTLWDLQTGQLANTLSLRDTAEIVNLNIGNDAQSESPTWSVSDIVFLQEQAGRDNVIAITIEHHSAQEDNTVLYFWDIGSQELTEVLTGIHGKNLAVSLNGQLLVAEIDEHLQVLDIPNKTVRLDLDPRSAASTTRLALSDMGLLARLERGDGVALWNTDGDLLATLETDKTISNIIFTPNGDLVVASYVENDDAPIEIWELHE